MSNKNVIVIVVALLIATTGVGAFMFLGNKSSNVPVAQQAQDTTNSNTQVADGPKSLRDLMSINNQMCTFVDAESSSEGTVYAGNGKMRGDFSVKMGTTTIASHMISNSNDVYVWVDGGKGGFKGSLEAISKANAQSSDPKTKSVDPDRKIDFKCKSWIVDNSKFNLPNMEFVDFNSMMSAPSGVPSATGSGSANTDMKASQCAACDNLSPDAAIQCKQALSC